MTYSCSPQWIAILCIEHNKVIYDEIVLTSIREKNKHVKVSYALGTRKDGFVPE